jgi:ATP-binding cassette subfamily F protein 3
MIIQISKGTVFFGTNEVFENIDFQVVNNEKIALIGRNGSGKTTLLRVLAGELELNSGELYVSKDTRIGYLTQTNFSYSENVVYNELALAFSELIEQEKELNRLAKIMEEDHDPSIIKRYADLENSFRLNGGYNYQNEIRSVFFGFGFTEDDLVRRLSEFSGGERTKIAFAKLLLSKPDLLLLDEPTNHLDLNSIKWLEGYLAKYEKAVILISHDRAFINKATSIIYEMEYGSLTRYVGSYEKYQEQKKNDLILKERAYKRQEKDIKRLEELIEKFRYKKNKAAFAQSKIKYLERMERIDKPQRPDDKTFHARFECKVKGGKNVLSMDRLQYGYDHPLGEVTLEILRGRRVCIMGDNGTGKSTLVKTIVGLLPPLGGYLMFGHQIEVGYFDQQLADFNTNNTVLEEVWNENPELDNTQIRTVLGTFLFSSDEVFKEVRVLSGGEKVRLSLTKLMLKKANFLILDEPTNHLDIPSKEALEASLKDYDGTILFVSHDRYFIKNIADSILYLENGKATFYDGEYEEYLDVRKKEEKKVETEKKEEDTARLSRRPKYNIKKIEQELMELEDLLEDKRALRFEEEYYQDSAKMNVLDEEIDDIHNQIAKVTETWELAIEEEEQRKKQSS